MSEPRRNLFNRPVIEQQRPRGIGEILADAHGRELNRRGSTAEDYSLNQFVDDSLRSLPADDPAAKQIREWRTSQQATALPWSTQNQRLAEVNAELGGESAFTDLVGKLNPFDGGFGSRKGRSTEEIINKDSGTNVFQDVVRAGMLGSQAYMDTLTLGGWRAAREKATELQSEITGFPSIVPGMSSEEVTQQLTKEREGGGRTARGGVDGILDRSAQGLRDAQAAQGASFVTGTAEGLGSLLAMFGPGGISSWVNKFGNVLKVSGAAVKGLPMLGRALQNPILNMSLTEGLLAGGQAATQKLIGDDADASKALDSVLPRMLNGAVLGALGAPLQLLGRGVERALLKRLTTSGESARWLGQAAGDLPNVFAKMRAGLARAGGKAVEFQMFSWVPDVYRPGKDGKYEPSPWVTTILNPIAIQEAIEGKDGGKYGQAVAELYEHFLGSYKEHAATGVVMSMIGGKHHRVGGSEKWTEPFKSLVKPGPAQSTEAIPDNYRSPEEAQRRSRRTYVPNALDLQRERATRTKREARENLTPAERKAVSEAIKTQFDGLDQAGREEAINAIVKFAAAAGEADVALAKRRGGLPPDAPTLAKTVTDWIGETLGDKVFEGKAIDKDTPGLGVEVELVRDPARPNQPGRKAEILERITTRPEALQSAADPERRVMQMLRVRFEDGSIGLVPMENVRQVVPGEGIGDGSAPPSQGTPTDPVGRVRNMATGETGVLRGGRTLEDGTKVGLVEIGGQVREMPADQLQAWNPGQFPETELSKTRNPAPRPGQPPKPKPEPQLPPYETPDNFTTPTGKLRVARRMAGKWAQSPDRLADVLAKRLAVTPQEAMELIERLAVHGEIPEATWQKARDGFIRDSYGDPGVWSVPAGKEVKAYRSLLRSLGRASEGGGQNVPRLLGRAKRLWDLMSPEQRSKVLEGRGERDLLHHELEKPVKRQGQVAEKAPVETPQEPQEAPKAEPAPSEAAAPPASEGVNQGRRAADQGPAIRGRRASDFEPAEGDTPEVAHLKRRARRSAWVAAGRKAQAREAEAQAATDKLTGLGNRAAFDREVEKAEAVSIQDLTGQKAKNDAVSYAEGDKLIQSAAEAALRAADEVGLSRRNVYRLGGDEFAAVGPRDKLDAWNAKLAQVDLGGTDLPGGKRVSHRFAGGVGKDQAEADARMLEAKKASKAERAAKGEATSREEIEGGKAARRAYRSPQLKEVAGYDVTRSENAIGKVTSQQGEKRRELDSGELKWLLDTERNRPERLEREGYKLDEKGLEDHKRWIEYLQDAYDAAKARERILEDGKGATFAAARQGDERTFTVGPDASKPGKWRVTRMDKDGPLGHVEAETAADALKEAVMQGANIERLSTATGPEWAVPVRKGSGSGYAVGLSSDNRFLNKAGTPTGLKAIVDRVQKGALSIEDGRAAIDAAQTWHDGLEKRGNPTGRTKAVIKKLDSAISAAKRRLDRIEAERNKPAEQAAEAPAERGSGPHPVTEQVEPKRNVFQRQPPPKVVKKGDEYEKGARIAGVDGKEHEVTTPEGTYKARYRVVELDDIRQSHDPNKGFAWDPDYPRELQPRDYETNTSIQERVRERAGQLNVEQLISDHPTAGEGPPIQVPDGVLISGNGRTMSVKLADDATIERIKQAIIDRAERFGIDPEAVKAMKRPMLVREVELDARSKEAKAFAREANMETVASDSPLRLADNYRHLIEPEHLSALGADPDATFAAIVNDKARGKSFRDALRKALPKQSVDRYFDGEGMLTDAGKELANNVLLAHAIPVETVERMTPAERRTVLQAVPQLMEARNHEVLREFVDAIPEAVEFMRKHLTGTNVKTIEEALDQGTLFGDKTEITGYGAMMADYLIRNGERPRIFRSNLKSALNRLGQETGLLGGDPYKIVAEELGVPIREGDGRLAEPMGKGDKGLAFLPDGMDASRANELTPAERDAFFGAADPVQTQTMGAPVGGLRLPKSDLPAADWSGTPAKASKVIQAIEKLIDAPFYIGRSIALRSKALGWWDPRRRYGRLRKAGDVPVAAHEAGHALEDAIWPELAKSKQSGQMLVELTRLGRALYPIKPWNGWDSEGFAEFFRLYLTRPELVKQHAPETTKWFESTFNVDNKAWKKGLAEVRQMIKDLGDQGTNSRILEQTVKGPTGKGKLARLIDEMGYEKWVESQAPLHRLMQEWVAAGNAPLSPSENTERLADYLRGGASSRVRSFIKNGMTNAAGQPIARPLEDAGTIIKAAAKKYGLSHDDMMDQFRVYLIARRVTELHLQGRGPAHIDAREAYNETLRLEKAMPELNQAGHVVWEWNHGLLQYARELGVISKADETFMLDRGQYYIPLARDIPNALDVAGRGDSGGPFKRLKGGSGRDIKDPLAQMIQHAEAIVTFAHRRAVLNSVVKLADGKGMGRWIHKVDKDMIRKAKPLAAFKAQLEKAGVQITPGTDLSQLLTWYEPKQTPDGKDPIIPHRKTDGTVDWYQVDAKVYESLHTMDPFRLPMGMDLLLGVPARLKRAGTTGLRAGFGLVTNPLRDLTTIIIQGESRNPFEILKEWGISQAQSWAALFGKKSHYHELWESLGGNIHGPLGQDYGPSHRMANHLGRNRLQGTWADLKKGRVVTAAGDLLDLARDIFQVPENAPRVAAMRMAAKRIGYKPGQPMTFKQAMDFAIQMKRAGAVSTVDFNAAGTYARMINAVVPFFNVAIQGPRTFGRRLREDPIGTLLKGSIMTGLTAALWWNNKDEDWYKDMPDSEKFGFWHIAVGNQRVRIPRPFEIGAMFAGVPESVLDAHYREDPQTVIAALKQTFETMKPDILPVLVQEWSEQQGNYDSFRGQPIVPKAVQGRPAEEQYGPTTTVVAKLIGEAMGWSPYRVDHAINGIFGGVGSDTARLPGQINVTDRDWQPADIPVLGKVFAYDGLQGYTSKAVQTLFDMRSNLQERRNSKARPATPGELAALKVLENASEELKNMREVRAKQASMADRSRTVQEMRRISQEALKLANELLSGDLYGSTPQEDAPRPRARRLFGGPR